MNDLELDPSIETVRAGMERLSENEYPGRMIAIGRGAGNLLILAYALMGRSESSRDRIFVEEDDGVRTVSPTKTEKEMALDPQAPLIYYKAMKKGGGIHVVSNGAQTNPIYNNLRAGDPLLTAAKLAGTFETSSGPIDLSSYEPDSPNFTPRTSGVIDTRKEARSPFGITIAIKDPESDDILRKAWEVEDLKDLKENVGYCIHTYNDNGNPLPSFDSDPYPIPFMDNAEKTKGLLWDLLNKDNRVAIVTTEIAMPGPEYYMADRHARKQ